MDYEFGVIIHKQEQKQPFEIVVVHHTHHIVND